MFKSWYSYTELKEELFKGNSNLDKTEIVTALDFMESESHDWANFGMKGKFIFSTKEEKLQWLLKDWINCIMSLMVMILY